MPGPASALSRGGGRPCLAARAPLPALVPDADKLAAAGSTSPSCPCSCTLASTGCLQAAAPLRTRPKPLESRHGCVPFDPARECLAAVRVDPALIEQPWLQSKLSLFQFSVSSDLHQGMFMLHINALFINFHRSPLVTRECIHPGGPRFESQAPLFLPLIYLVWHTTQPAAWAWPDSAAAVALRTERSISIFRWPV
ncbi:hypothetical protein ACQJBY_021882 [Aegilops geniculata]